VVDVVVPPHFILALTQIAVNLLVDRMAVLVEVVTEKIIRIILQMPLVVAAQVGKETTEELVIMMLVLVEVELAVLEVMVSKMAMVVMGAVAPALE
tara:strand:- start:518 stop:805 length:288 start_codon:yes stop_codon:yes gene_type:complete